MGADAWRVCPQCKMRETAAVEAEDEAAAKAYGKVPAEDWKAMTLKAQDRRSALSSMEETFREDDEIWTEEDGEFSIEYSGRCATCGMTHKFKHSQQLTLSKGE